MRVAISIGLFFLALGRYCWPQPLAAVANIAVRSNEVTIQLSSSTTYAVQRVRYPDQLLITLDNCTISPRLSLPRASASWFTGVQADVMQGAVRLRFALTPGSRPEVFGATPARTLTITPGRGERVYGSAPPPSLPAPPPAQASPPPRESDRQAPPVTQPSSRPPSGAPSVTEIHYRVADDGSGQLHVGLTAPVRPNVFFLATDPRRPRLVVDLPGAVISPPESSLTPQSNDLVSRIRTGMPRGVARIVLDVAGKVRYKVETQLNPCQVLVNVSPPTAALEQPDAHMEPAPEPEAPSASSPVRPASLPNRLEDVTIVVDPGHGGKAAGARGPSGLLEKDVNLDIARRLRDVLQAEGVRALLSRDSDVDVPLRSRPSVCSQVQPAIFVSIHCNSNPARRLRGTETYYHLRDPVCRSLAWAIEQAVCAAAGTVNRGVRSDGIRFRSGFAVLDEASVPAVLVEVAYINNPEDEALLASPEFRQRVAVGIANGLRAYVEAPSAAAN